MQERSLCSAAPSYIICILLQVMMQVIAMHSQTPTLKTRDLLAYLIEMPAYEYTPHLYRLMEIHREILLCTHTHTGGLSIKDAARLQSNRLSDMSKKRGKKIFNYAESFSVNLCSRSRMGGGAITNAVPHA